MKTKLISSFAVKKIIFVLCTVFFAVLQNTFLPALGIDIPVFFLIPLCVAIAMSEYEFTGMLYGLLAGALWDISSPISDGIITLTFTVFALLAGLFTHYILRNTIITALVLTSSGVVIYSLINFIFNCLTRDMAPANFHSVIFYILGILLTTALTPVFYFPVKALSGKFNSQNDRSVKLS